MTMIVVEDPTTITSEIQTRQLVETTMITLLLSAGQQIIINLLSDLEKLFQKQFLSLYYLIYFWGCISLIFLLCWSLKAKTLHKQKKFRKT